jgi:glycogen(starch) synthase
MRLLFVTNLYPPNTLGGYEEVCRDVAVGLGRRGHDVWVLTSTYGPNTSLTDDDRTMRLLALQADWLSSAKPGSPARLFTAIRADWHNAQAVRRVISRVTPEIVIFWNGSNLGRSILSTTQEAAGVVAYYLGDWWLGEALCEGQYPIRLRRTAKLGLLRALRLNVGALVASHLVFVSEALRSDYAAMGVDVDDSLVIRNGVSSELFGLRPQRITAHLPGVGRKILFVGRITPEKGVATLVSALGKLRQRHEFQDVVLSLVGVVQDDRFRRRIEELIDDLGLGGAIQFVGHVPRSELPHVYEEHDVAVFPSEWREPFGLTLIEAMAMGLPVVTTVTGGPAEVVRNHENAIVFQTGDAFDLAKQLAWVLLNPIDAAAIGERASTDVLRRFTLDAQLSAFEAYLLSILKPTCRENRDAHLVGSKAVGPDC